MMVICSTCGITVTDTILEHYSEFHADKEIFKEGENENTDKED